MMHAPANASGEEHPNVDQEIKATWASVLDGRYNDAIARATKLLNQVDPIQDGEAYWRASSMWAWCLFDLGARERGLRSAVGRLSAVVVEARDGQAYLHRRLGRETGISLVSPNDECLSPRSSCRPVNRSPAHDSARRGL